MKTENVWIVVKVGNTDFEDGVVTAPLNDLGTLSVYKTREAARMDKKEEPGFGDSKLKVVKAKLLYEY